MRHRRAQYAIFTLQYGMFFDLELHKNQTTLGYQLQAIEWLRTVEILGVYELV